MALCKTMLLDLARRVEAAAGKDEKLDQEIHSKVVAPHLYDHIMWPSYTSSVDAAMNLIGENWWNIEAGCDETFFAKVLPWSVDCRGGSAANAPTPAQALTAAALRNIAERDHPHG